MVSPFAPSLIHASSDKLWRWTDLTLSGNEITDAVRQAALQGDGRATPDDSYGIWPAATNLCVNGGAETNTTGATDNSSTTTRITTQAKFGAASFNVVTSNLTANEGPSWAISGGAGNTQYTVSAWVRGAAGGTIRIVVSDTVGGKQASAAVTLTGTWQRITKTATTGVAGINEAVFVETDVQQALTFQIDGVQVETGAIATPYIETNGGTASRSAARVQMPVAGLFTATQGWIAMRFRPNWTSSAPANSGAVRAFVLQDDGAEILRARFAANTAQLDRQHAAAGTSAIVDPSFAAASLNTLIFTWSATLVGVSVNGAVFTTAGNTAIPTGGLQALADIGDNGLATRELAGDLLWFATGFGTLTDANAATINGFGNGKVPPNAFPGSPTGVWHCELGQFKRMKSVGL